jgi:predicted ATP-dependent endonuclease of OLD family
MNQASVRITKLKIKNIGKIEDMEVPFDHPLILFYGEIRQGKTTILNAVRWVCGGEFPEDIIRHGKDEAEIELSFDGGMISRSWYRGKDKDKTTKARPVTFIRNGKPVSKPVSEITRFLNPFLLDQDFLRKKTEVERKAYFAEIFAVDTTELDKEWFNNDRKASDLRVKIKAYGTIDLTPYEAVDISATKTQLQEIRARHQEALEEVQRLNEVARVRAGDRAKATTNVSEIDDEIKELEAQIVSAKARRGANLKYLEEHTELPPTAVPAAPDMTALEQTIQDAGATNVRAEQFAANKKRAEDKAADEDEVRKLEARQREIKSEKQSKLKTVTDGCKIKGLAFDDEGNFTYEGCQAGMLSTSQVMKLSSELSGLYPDGFGIELLDRGESLGKSIFDFVERAKEEKKTILATIVGERPAVVPKDIGVFVVQDGKLQTEELL